MKQIVIIVLLLLPGALFAQQEKSYVKQGNQLYQEKKYKEAEAEYRKALAKKNQNVEGNFNLGDALYKQKQLDKAGEQFGKIAEANKNKTIAASAYHNLGNTLLEGKKLEESIEAYKKSLINNPKDEQTRYNLAYAQEKLKKQQQQDKNNNKNKNNKDKNKDKQNKDKQDKKDQDKKNQDKKNQDQQKKDQPQQQKPEPNKLSKDDAQRMLDALNNNEKQTQDKLKNKKLKGAKMQISKDW